MEGGSHLPAGERPVEGERAMGGRGGCGGAPIVLQAGTFFAISVLILVVICVPFLVSAAPILFTTWSREGERRAVCQSVVLGLNLRTQGDKKSRVIQDSGSVGVCRGWRCLPRHKALATGAPSHAGLPHSALCRRQCATWQSRLQ